MNKKVIQKCIDELNKKKDANISYVLGMLETLVEMDEPVQFVSSANYSSSPFNPTIPNNSFGGVLPGGIAVPQTFDSLSPEEQAVMAAMDSLGGGTPNNAVLETNIVLN